MSENSNAGSEVSEKTRTAIARLSIALVIWLVAVVLLWRAAGWQTLAGVFLFVWANNIIRTPRGD